MAGLGIGVELRVRKGLAQRLAGRRPWHRRHCAGGKAAVDQAGGHAGRGCAARHGQRVLAQGQRQRHRMRVAALHPQVQITKLRGQARVELDHRQALGGGIKKELHVEKAMGIADGRQKTPRHVQRPGLHLGRQRGRQLPAHEGLGAGVHHCVHHAQRMDLAVLHPAVQVVLGRAGGQRGLQHQPVGAAGTGQAQPRHALERLDQAADHPQLAPAEAGVGLQRVPAVHLARQHRERRLHRLDIGGVVQALWHVVAIGHIQGLEGDVGLGRHRLQHPSRMQLVLGGQHRFGRGAGQAQVLGHQGCGQRAELLMVGQHGGPAVAGTAPGLAGGKAQQVEVDQRGIAGEAEQVEAGTVKAGLAAQAGKGLGVPIVVEQQADLRQLGARHRHQARPREGRQRRQAARAPQGSTARASRPASRAGLARSGRAWAWASAAPAQA